jgi:hypothetical protein
LSTKQY